MLSEPHFGTTALSNSIAAQSCEAFKGIIALYVVVNALVQYVFDAAAIETALEQLLSLQMVLSRV